jgi:hypothetical protein
VFSQSFRSAIRTGLVDGRSFSFSEDQFVRGVLPILDVVRKTGAKTLAEIAGALNDRGVRSASGGQWHRSAVLNLLARAQSCEA